MGGELGNLVKKVKGLRSTDWQLQNSHGNVKYRIRNTVRSIVITMYGARGVLEIPGQHFVKCMIL